MKIKNKWKLGLLFLGALVLTGCTKSFVTVQDKVNMMIIYQNQEVSEGKTNLDQIVENVNKTGNYFAPSEAFFDYIEENVAETVHTMYATATLKVNDVEKAYSDYTLDELLQDGATRDAFVLSNEYALTKYAKEKATTSPPVTARSISLRSLKSPLAREPNNKTFLILYFIASFLMDSISSSLNPYIIIYSF